ncbi:MAG: hypothetical protein ABUT20_47155 [Bacteroidota bacterium]
MDQLEEKISKDFSFISFLTVTGLCFFIFSFVMKLLDGLSMPLFNKIGSVCIGLAVVSLLVKSIIPAKEKKNSSALTEK